MFKSTKLMDVYSKYAYFLRLVKVTYWTIAGLISLLTVVNFVYNDSDGETLAGAFFVSILLIGFLQIIFVPIYFAVRRIASAIISDNILKPKLDTNAPNDFKGLQLPPLDLLVKPDNHSVIDKQKKQLSKQTDLLTKTVKKYGCDVTLDSVETGPRLNVFHYKPKIGETVKDTDRLERAIAQVLDDGSVRVNVDTKLNGLVHIEIVRDEPDTISLREVLESEEYVNSKFSLPLPLGKTAAGDYLVSDIRKSPHIMIAGQTGSGKSVMLNNLIISLITKHSPETLRLLLIDPKVVEFSAYNDIPYLLREVITSPEESTKALEWLVEEMERRFYQLAETRTKNIEEFNTKEPKPMPYIVMVIDEFADLMMMDGENTEKLIVKIAQKARAVGIHMVIATSRPSVDVFTGMIKANLPARIAFTTASKVDSRTVIDANGAERLLGRGDMIYSDIDLWPPVRAHAALITDEEVVKVTDFLREQSA